MEEPHIINTDENLLKVGSDEIAIKDFKSVFLSANCETRHDNKSFF